MVMSDANWNPSLEGKCQLGRTNGCCRKKATPCTARHWSLHCVLTLGGREGRGTNLSSSFWTWDATKGTQEHICPSQGKLADTEQSGHMGLVPLPQSTLTKLEPPCVPTCLLQNSLQNATVKGAFLGHQRKCVQQPSPPPPGSGDFNQLHPL